MDGRNKSGHDGVLSRPFARPAFPHRLTEDQRGRGTPVEDPPDTEERERARKHRHPRLGIGDGPASEQRPHGGEGRHQHHGNQGAAGRAAEGTQHLGWCGPPSLVRTAPEEPAANEERQQQPCGAPCRCQHDRDVGRSARAADFERENDPLEVPIGSAAVSACARRYLLQAGVLVPRPGSHTLRHTLVQRLVDSDFALKEIGDFVGHRSPRSTQIYGKVAVESLRQVALGDGEEVLNE